MALRTLDRRVLDSTKIIAATGDGDDEADIIPIRDGDMHEYYMLSKEPEVSSSISVIVSRLLTHDIEFAGCDEKITNDPIFRLTWLKFVDDMIHAQITYGFCAVNLDPMNPECPKVLEWNEYAWFVVRGKPTDPHQYRLIPRKKRNAKRIKTQNPTKEIPEKNPHVFVAEFAAPGTSINRDYMVITSKIAGLLSRFMTTANFMRSWSGAVAGSSVPVIFARQQKEEDASGGISETDRDLSTGARARLSSASSSSATRRAGSGARAGAFVNADRINSGGAAAAVTGAPSYMSLASSRIAGSLSGDVPMREADSTTLTTAQPLPMSTMMAQWYSNGSREVMPGRIAVLDVPDDVAVQNAPAARVPNGLDSVRKQFASDASGVLGVPSHVTAGGSGDGGPSHEASAFTDNLVLRSAVETTKVKLDIMMTAVYLLMYVHVDPNADTPQNALTGVHNSVTQSSREKVGSKRSAPEKPGGMLNEPIVDPQAIIDKVKVRVTPSTTTAAVLRLVSMGALKWEYAREQLAKSTGLSIDKFVTDDPFSAEKYKSPYRKKTELDLIDRFAKTDPNTSTFEGGRKMAADKIGDGTV